MKSTPRRLSFAFKLKFLPQGLWLDVGAGNGHYLQFMPAGSLGVDINENPNLGISKWNFLNPLPAELEKRISVVWCSNLIEHVLDPHRFLINLRLVLKDDKSLVLIACPNTISLQKGPWRGTLAADHINFFNLRTLKLTMQFAGYEIVYAGSPSFPYLPLSLSKLLGSFGPTLFVAARPISNFQYSPKAHKVLGESGEIIFKNDTYLEL